MSNDAQTIILIVVLLIALALFFIPFILFFVYVFFQTSKRKRIRERMLAANQQLVGTKRWLPVRYASEPRFKSWFKIFPWEGSGVLVLAPGSSLFLGETNSGASVILQFAPGNSTINWIGKSPFPNGAVSWFQFTTATEKHFFSSETGAFVFGSHRSTKEIFDEACKSFAGQG
jgi:hypothetical protein